MTLSKSYGYTWIPVLSLLLLASCSEETAPDSDMITNGSSHPDQETEEPLYLAGAWELSITPGNETCSLARSVPSAMTVYVEDNIVSYHITDRSAFQINGRIVNDILKIKTTEQLEIDGCSVTRELTGEGWISADSIGGTWTATIIPDYYDCNQLADCRATENFLMVRVKECNCPDQDQFGTPTSSQYLLPFSSGESYMLERSYCEPETDHEKKFAYDFRMDMGETVVAARAGTVIGVVEKHPNEGHLPNSIMIEHSDKSVALYSRLLQNSAIVRAGEEVKAGQLIARSGCSGAASPHLHFAVHGGRLFNDDNDIPVNFRNAIGPLDACDGLVVGGRYEAKFVATAP